MFQPIPTGIRTSAQHGGVVLLESFSFAQGDLTVRVYAPGSGDEAELRFCDVVGFTMREDVMMGTAPRPSRPGAAPRPDAAFFLTAPDTPMADATRTAPNLGAHKHYRLHLREHELSFVAGADYEIDVAAQTPAN